MRHVRPARSVSGHRGFVSQRTPVARHATNKSVGTDLPPAYGRVKSRKGSSGLSAAQQAGSYYARAANRAGRPPLA
jgi:hypothetical protein